MQHKPFLPPTGLLFDLHPIVPPSHPFPPLPNQPPSSLSDPKMLSAKSLILRARAPLQQAARQSNVLPLITRQPRSMPSAVVAFRSQPTLQERTLFTPTRVAFAANTADIEKGVQNITDLFMVARDEVIEREREAHSAVLQSDF